MTVRRPLLVLAAALALAAPARATVNTAASSTTAIGTGAQTQFPFAFIGVSPAYITVIYTDASGNQSVVAPTAYTIALNAPVQGATWGVGGTVTYAPATGAIPAGATLTIARTIPLLQAISLQNQASYGAIGKASEKASDLLEMQLQQVSATQGRALVANIANSAPPVQLPPAAQVADLALCFDGTGNNVVACAGLPSANVSSAILPALTSSSYAAFRTAIGLGSISTYNVGAGLQSDGGGGVRATQVIVGDGISISVNATFHDEVRVADNPLTYTLPASATLWNGFSFTIVTGGNSVSVALPSTDAFFFLASGQSLSLPQYSVTTISTNGAGEWFAAQSDVPTNQPHYPGEVIKMRGQACPLGTLLEDGSAFSASAYPLLYAQIGTTYGAGPNLPDSRGLFDRNWASGQTVDAGRAFGSTEQDQLHTFTATYSAPANTALTANSNSGFNAYNANVGYTQFSAALSGATFGSETRPKNITTVSCIVTGATR